MTKNASHPEMAQTQKILQERQAELAYRVALGAIASFQCPHKLHNSLVGADHGALYLQGALYSQIFDEQGHLLTAADEGFGRRTVVLIKKGEHCLHAKENPELPGMEYAVGTLRRQLIGHGAPYTELFKCQTAKGEAYPLQLAKTVPGENFHTVLRAAKRRSKRPSQTGSP